MSPKLFFFLQKKQNNHEKITLKNTLKTEMSTPGWVKDHRQVQPLTEDLNTQVAEMETNYILKSTLTGESREEKGDTNTCLCPGNLRPGPPGSGQCFEEGATVQTICGTH
jgi:hypothetical protein